MFQPYQRQRLSGQVMAPGFIPTKGNYTIYRDTPAKLTIEFYYAQKVILRQVKN